jgi:G3E family GTPase
LEILLSVGRFRVANVDAQRERADGGAGEAHHRHDSNDRLFETWSYESDRPVSLEALRKMVQRELPASVYRCKGIVFATDFPDKRLALQVVGRRTEISELDEWGKRTPLTQIVAIGAQINAQELNKKFNDCIEQS